MAWFNDCYLATVAILYIIIDKRLNINTVGRL